MPPPPRLPPLPRLLPTSPTAPAKPIDLVAHGAALLEDARHGRCGRGHAGAVGPEAYPSPSATAAAGDGVASSHEGCPGAGSHASHCGCAKDRPSADQGHDRDGGHDGGHDAAATIVRRPRPRSQHRLTSRSDTSGAAFDLGGSLTSCSSLSLSHPSLVPALYAATPSPRLLATAIPEDPPALDDAALIHNNSDDDPVRDRGRGGGGSGGVGGGPRLSHARDALTPHFVDGLYQRTASETDLWQGASWTPPPPVASPADSPAHVATALTAGGTALSVAARTPSLPPPSRSLMVTSEMPATRRRQSHYGGMFDRSLLRSLRRWASGDPLAGGTDAATASPVIARSGWTASATEAFAGDDVAATRAGEEPSDNPSSRGSQALPTPWAPMLSNAGSATGASFLTPPPAPAGPPPNPHVQTLGVQSLDTLTQAMDGVGDHNVDDGDDHDDAGSGLMARLAEAGRHLWRRRHSDFGPQLGLAALGGREGALDSAAKPVIAPDPRHRHVRAPAPRLHSWTAVDDSATWAAAPVGRRSSSASPSLYAFGGSASAEPRSASDPVERRAGLDASRAGGRGHVRPRHGRASSWWPTPFASTEKRHGEPRGSQPSVVSAAGSVAGGGGEPPSLLDGFPPGSRHAMTQSPAPMTPIIDSDEFGDAAHRHRRPLPPRRRFEDDSSGGRSIGSGAEASDGGGDDGGDGDDGRRSSGEVGGGPRRGRLRRRVPAGTSGQPRHAGFGPIRTRFHDEAEAGAERGLDQLNSVAPMAASFDGSDPATAAQAITAETAPPAIAPALDSPSFLVDSQLIAEYPLGVYMDIWVAGEADGRGGGGGGGDDDGGSGWPMASVPAGSAAASAGSPPALTVLGMLSTSPPVARLMASLAAPTAYTVRVALLRPGIPGFGNATPCQWHITTRYSALRTLYLQLQRDAAAAAPPPSAAPWPPWPPFPRKQPWQRFAPETIAARAAAFARIAQFLCRHPALHASRALRDFLAWPAPPGGLRVLHIRKRPRAPLLDSGPLSLFGDDFDHDADDDDDDDDDDASDVDPDDPQASLVVLGFGPSPTWSNPYRVTSPTSPTTPGHLLRRLAVATAGDRGGMDVDAAAGGVTGMATSPPAGHCASAPLSAADPSATFHGWRRHALPHMAGPPSAPGLPSPGQLATPWSAAALVPGTALPDWLTSQPGGHVRYESQGWA